ncbi:helix-turn-helix domain-containing protein [Actinoplanes sp. NPDC051851]|uniref:helix-turn-helix domain-containing protein n=1 Tax=Actinoplanes sp. NPDC051851 TaxID=3154753 RepID=UPI0034120EB6
MSAAVSFSVGAGYAVYRGPSGDGRLHSHAAFQIAVAVRGEVAMLDAEGAEHRAGVLLVPPMVRHRLLPASALRTMYVEPHSALADLLRRRCAGRLVAAPELRDLGEAELDRGFSAALDPRLLAALAILRERPVAMPALAAEVGLSAPRLRALAHAQLGMPLTRWRAWSGLHRAAEALRAGESLAGAAATAGFADQAHLTRRMREMIGLTPAAVLPVLRGDRQMTVP